MAVDDLLEISGEVGIKSRRVAQFYRVRLSQGDGFGKQATGIVMGRIATRRPLLSRLR